MGKSKMKDYLGDGVYADHDGYNIVLTTDNGVAVSNIIYLEPEVVVALIKYIEKTKKKKGEG